MALTDRAMDAGAVMPFDEVTGIVSNGTDVRVESASVSWLARHVVWAAGSSPGDLGITASTGWTPAVCASCDGPLHRDRPVAVIGGGELALAEVKELASFASAVTVMVPDGST